MTDFGKIAKKLEARRVRFAVPRPPEEDGIDISYRLLFTYPWVTLACFPLVGTVIAAIVLGLIAGLSAIWDGLAQ